RPVPSSIIRFGEDWARGEAEARWGPAGSRCRLPDLRHESRRVTQRLAPQHVVADMRRERTHRLTRAAAAIDWNVWGLFAADFGIGSANAVELADVIKRS